MDPADILVFLIIGLSGLFAFFKGAVREVLSIVSWIGAGYITFVARPVIDPLVSEYISSPLLSAAITILSVFIIALLILSQIARMVSSRIEDGSGGTLNRTLGLLFGLARGLIIVGIIYSAIVIYSPDETPEFLANAKTLPVMEASSAVMLALIPDSAKEKAAKSVDDSGESLIDALNPVEMLKGLGSADDSTADTPEEKGYNPAERQQMDRLFDGLPELN